MTDPGPGTSLLSKGTRYRNYGSFDCVKPKAMTLEQERELRCQQAKNDGVEVQRSRLAFGAGQWKQKADNSNQGFTVSP